MSKPRKITPGNIQKYFDAHGMTLNSWYQTVIAAGREALARQVSEWLDKEEAKAKLLPMEEVLGKIDGNTVNPNDEPLAPPGAEDNLSTDPGDGTTKKKKHVSRMKKRKKKKRRTKVIGHK